MRDIITSSNESKQESTGNIMTGLRSPYPYFGGKSTIARLIWERLGDVPNFVDPFFGSGAVLLSRPDFDPARHLETINDLDGFIANAWRAMAAAPDEVARYADHPVNENDLHARHIWLVNRKDSIVASLEGDPDWFDAKVAGWWLWGMACWIGHGFCSGVGPWQSVDGKRVHVGDAGQGVNRKLVHVGNAGQGVNRQRVHVGDAGQGVNGLQAWFAELAERMARVRVCCGDWTRVTGPTVTFKHGLTGIVLDPPYIQDTREAVYGHDSATIASEVREWAIANGDNPLLRIAYCGYEDGFTWPDGWDCVAWKGPVGLGTQRKDKANTNRHLERIWFSPHCLRAKAAQLSLFDTGGAR